MVFVVVLLTGKQLVGIIDVVEIQVQGRRCWVLEMGNILPFFAFDCAAIDGTPVVAGYFAGGSPVGCLSARAALMTWSLLFAMSRFRSQLTPWETFL